MKELMLKLSPPWVVFQKKVRALFEEDPDVIVCTGADSVGPFVKLYVAKPLKAAALARLLPGYKAFGSVRVSIAVVPGNGDLAMPEAPESVPGLAEAAFDGNAAVTEIRQVSKGFFRDLAYVAFNPVVVQFPADDLSDINGNWSGLYADIAKELFENNPGICFCTASSGKALKAEMWP